MALRLVVNGVVRVFAELEAGARLTDLVASLGLKTDRVAVERNGEIAPRKNWASIALVDGDRLELVHFVGGGLSLGLTSRHCT